MIQLKFMSHHIYCSNNSNYKIEQLITVDNFKHDVDIIVLNEDKEKSIEQELTEDMMMLLASFSGKMYGLRSHKN